MADDKTKHKKSHKQKSKSKDSSKHTVDDRVKSSKRKRDSEPGRNNKKNKQHDAYDRINGTPLLVAEETDRKPIIVNGLATSVSDEPANLPLTPTPRETVGSEPTDTPARNSSKRRGARTGAKNGKKVGFFEEKETKAVEKFKVEFCNSHGLDATTFDAMVQHSERSETEFPCSADVGKKEFWSSVFELLPDRDRRSVYRFMRRHFQHSTQKPHEWTEEQDEELIQMHAKYGPKWTKIARDLGRSDDDVTQRWKNHLEHRETMRHGTWSKQELQDLLHYVVQIAKDRQERGSSENEYQMDDKIIPWGTISNNMRNLRTRQQCADRWRKIRKAILHTRATTDPNAVFDPAEAARRSSRGSEKPSTQKSKEYVNETDSDDGSNERTLPARTSVDITKAHATEPAPQTDSESEPTDQQDDASSQRSSSGRSDS